MVMDYGIPFNLFQVIGFAEFRIEEGLSVFKKGGKKPLFTFLQSMWACEF